MTHLHQRLLVAVTMEKNFFRGLGRKIVRRVVLQKLAEQKCLVSELVGALIGRKQIVQLIPKHRSATRLQYNYGQPRTNLRDESIHDLAQVVFGILKHAKVIKRSPAA